MHSKLSAERHLSVLTALTSFIVGSNGIVTSDGHTGKLPTLGWNSWNAFHCDITEDKFLSAAKVIVDSGLADAGYTYVNIDDCWQEMDGRSDDGHLVPNATRFPDNGIQGLADKVHDMGLKLGIYSTAGTETCAGYPASLEHEDVDAEDFASWGIDYLKYDNCNVPDDWQDEYVSCQPDSMETDSNGTCNYDLTPNLAPKGYDWTTSKSWDRFNRMRDALAEQDRLILYNLCIWGFADVFSWGNDTAVSWRMSGDIQPTWADVTRILNINSFKMNYVDFWSHNDADMLEVGNGLSPEESRSHFALWAAMKSPLLIGTDMDKLTDGDLSLLKNKYLLAFNQDDVYGGPATPYKWGVNDEWTFDDNHPAEFWAGPSQAGHLVLMLNTLDDSADKKATWSEIPGLKDGCDGGCSYKVTDVWTGDDLGCLEEYSSDVASHDTAAILVGDKC